MPSHRPATPELLDQHRQLPDASSAASAYEAVAKLHGLIRPDAFPIQLGSPSKSAEFGSTDPLSGLGVQATENRYDLLLALDVVLQETKQGRYPLVSLPVDRGGGRADWRVFLCARHRSKLLLIDPAVPKVVARGPAGIKKRFVSAVLATHERAGIRILTYRLPSPGRAGGLRRTTG
jgi:hypothetical protein